MTFHVQLHGKMKEEENVGWHTVYSTEELPDAVNAVRELLADDIDREAIQVVNQDGVQVATVAENGIRIDMKALNAVE